MFPDRGFTKSTCAVKPPLGLEPMDVWIERRRIQVQLAIARYKKAGMDVPAEWYDEYYTLTSEM